MENGLLLRDYRPESTLKAKRTPIGKCRYPVIDVHNHLKKVFDIDDVTRVMDEVGVKTIVNLDGGWGDTLRNNIDRLDKKYPGRFITFCNLDFSLIDDPGFKTHVRNTIGEGVKYGMGGVKIFKQLGLKYRDSQGKLVLPDDDRLRVIWETAAEWNIPVLYHIADPLAFFQPLSGKNERIEQLTVHPDWSFYGPEFPTREELFACQRNMLEKNPRTRFILPHIASSPEDLEHVSKLLDTYSNFTVDISARIGDLGRQPYSARKFLIKYADRVLFGLDGGIQSQRYIILFRFLETDDEYFDYREPGHNIISRWMVCGVFLPDDVLKKIYYQNALKVLGKV